LGHDVKDSKVFSWTLRDWKKLEKKLTSEEFECGGHKWYVPSIFGFTIANEVTISRHLYYRRILLFPFGKSNPHDTVSVYLDYADPKKAPEGWHACAQFAFVISNPSDPTIFTVSRMS
jgi:ubiquitin carboxyl-terminal hydrolase 7